MSNIQKMKNATRKTKGTTASKTSRVDLSIISIPRPLQTVQPKLLSHSVLPIKETFEVSGTSSTYWGNFPVLNSLYQVINGSVATIPGLDQLSRLYTAYTAVKANLKFTFTNNKVNSLAVYVIPTVGPVSAGQGSIQPLFRVPESRGVMLGSVSGSDAQKTIRHQCDTSKLVGYNIDGHYSFITLFGSNPSIPTGFTIVYFSADSTTLPVMDVQIEGEIHVIGVTAKKILL